MSEQIDDPYGLLSGYSTGRLTPKEEHCLFAAAAEDQDLFSLLMEAEAIRDALDSPEQRSRIKRAVLVWHEQPSLPVVSPLSIPPPPETEPTKRQTVTSTYLFMPS